MSYEALTAKHLNNLKEKIQRTIASKGLDNSGEAFNSLEVKGNQLLGNDYIYFLDQGRAPGKFPPTLISWVKNKLGLEGSEAKQVDFLVRRKIARDGTNIYRNKSKGIELDTLVEDTLNELTKELPDYAASEALKWL